MIQNANEVTSQAVLDLKDMVTQIVNKVNTKMQHMPQLSVQKHYPQEFMLKQVQRLLQVLLP
jgi:hypothetical protein